jgi:hypothetical protein
VLARWRWQRVRAARGRGRRRVRWQNCAVSASDTFMARSLGAAARGGGGRQRRRAAAAARGRNRHQSWGGNGGGARCRHCAGRRAARIGAGTGAGPATICTESLASRRRGHRTLLFIHIGVFGRALLSRLE